VERALDELVHLVEEARTLPMSSSAVVHRGEVLEQLAQLRALLPSALGDARRLLEEREQVLEQGRREVEQLREQAQAERAALIEKSGVHRLASAEADRLLASAQEQADALRAEVEDYVDGKLANMEVVLSKTLDAVQRGRARLSGRSELDELGDRHGD
jgi:cell division septum initiation protein DivIVA